MNDYWYNHPVNSEEFKTGLEEALESQLVKLLVAFTVRQGRGEKGNSQNHGHKK
ncbi:hypothetical protein ACJDU8_17580 [Clostridium sp. WILCCON 0269]|uniref:Uncharacterized protein n=1 Tax=Candidatus Clostridium eludens TaxID=3381663 RepID=A0ABW8SNW0_9CLOT